MVIGNAKKWKSGEVGFINHSNCPDIALVDLKAELISKSDEFNVVEFSWSGGFSFSQVLEMCGKIPIPPYLNRETELLDIERYQTLYAKYRGSVAAPTAGLHFTDNVLNDIIEKGITKEEICLHVGAGTFLPVKSEYIADHTMHSEPFSVTIHLLKSILNIKEQEKIIAVGTTSTRSLESIYFLGVQCIEQGTPTVVEQWDPYSKEYNYTLKESVGALINYMESNALSVLNTRTRIIITPKYKFRVVDILITNFHQPKSTLLLLISAFIGERWRDVYSYALDNEFRFLSYGDSSILFRQV